MFSTKDVKELEVLFIGCYLCDTVPGTSQNISDSWFLFTYEDTPSLLELLLLTVAFLGIIVGMYLYFDHVNQKKKEEQRAEQNKND